MEGWDLLEIWQYTGHTDESVFKMYFKPTFEHEQIRQESIKARNEKLQRVDLQAKQIEDLHKRMLKKCRSFMRVETWSSWQKSLILTKMFLKARKLKFWL